MCFVLLAFHIATFGTGSDDFQIRHFWKYIMFFPVIAPAPNGFQTLFLHNVSRKFSKVFLANFQIFLVLPVFNCS